ncbi:MAG: TIGR03643 family protein [Chthoniobacteraceae bacterium]|nr:TIGR03643 family protein [Chthoniobacteraceae bacterium]
MSQSSGQGILKLVFSDGTGISFLLTVSKRGGVWVALGTPSHPTASSFMKPTYSSEQVSMVIRYAWEDRTTFEEIEKRTGLVEKQVVELMRRELKPSSFRMWRKRVCGRVTKHRRLLERHLSGPRIEE